MHASATLARWLAAGEARAHPGRTATAVVAIAIGVALGFAVHLINRSALVEFSSAVRATTGEADVELRGIGLAVRRGFDDAAFDAIVALHDVAAASPVVEVDAPVAVGARRLRDPLRVLGLDPLRAVAINPGFVGRVAPELRARGAGIEPLDDRAIFLSPAALAWLGVSFGDAIEVGGAPFVVAGSIPGATQSLRVGVVDIAAAQTRLHHAGRLSRIDVRLAPGATARSLAAAVGALPALADIAVVAPETDEARVSNVSRAYRVNMNVLAMVALFTGAFLVYSVQTLAVARRRAMFALLRVVGLARRTLVAQVLAEGVVLGTIGALAGIAAGAALAAAVLEWRGGDLGGGYFAGTAPALVWSWPAALLYAALGIAAASLGSVVPALDAARAPPARALKSGSDEHVHASIRRPWHALAIGALGVALTFAPPIAGLPIAGYVAVALMLVAGIAAMPWLAHVLARRAASRFENGRSPALVLAAARVANAPGQILRDKYARRRALFNYRGRAGTAAGRGAGQTVAAAGAG
jgi:putative ABC transport system permease protein